MKKIINILLLFVFATTFFACNKEVIKPFNDKGEHLQSCESTNDDEGFTRGSSDLKGIDDDSVTDPDEEEDFEEDDTVTDPDEEEDFEEEEFSK